MKPVEEFVASHHLIQRRHPLLKKFQAARAASRFCSILPAKSGFAWVTKAPKN
jgi:hypothetical protein